MIPFTGTVLDQALTVALGLSIAALAFFIVRKLPRVAIVVAILSLCAVPIWIGVGVGFNGNLFLPVAAVVTSIAALALLPARRFRPSLVDGLLLFLIIVAASSLLTSSTGIALAFLVTPFSYFVGGYALGRIASSRVDIRWVYGAVAVAFTIVSVGAIVEFATGWNPFVEWKASNSLFDEWGDLQLRGGVLRAEGAFGHPIALGASLALAVPLTLASRFRFSVRLAMVVLMFIATVLTFSRIGIIGALLGAALCVVFLRDAFTPAMRVALVIVGGLSTLVLFPIVSRVFTEAGTEATASAQYRGDLVPLLQQTNLVGFSDLVRQSPDGTLYFGNFQSIDSQFVLTALSNGAFALAAVLISLVIAIVIMLRGRASAATIAVIAQIPALATVALITQYSVFLWFVIGLAATSQVQRRRATTTESPLQATPQVPNKLGVKIG